MDVVTTRHPRRTADNPGPLLHPSPQPGGRDVGPIPVRPSPTCARVHAYPTECGGARTMTGTSGLCAG